jgi:hypothetical protein
VQVRGCSGGCCSGVGKLRHGRWAAATLLAAVAAASCEHLPAAPPGAAGYLAAGRSSVAFLRLPGTPGAAVSGSLELNAISGTAPHTTVSARTYPFTGRLSGRRVLIIRINGAPARGRLAGRGLTLGPLPGSAGPRAFAAARAGSYDRAVAALRGRAASANALAGRRAASAALRRRQVRQAVAGLITAATAVRQARRVVSSQLSEIGRLTSVAAGALGKARRDAQTALARARLGARGVLVCDYAVLVGSDALAVSANSTGVGTDAGSLAGDLSALRDTITALAAQLRAVQLNQPGYRGGGTAPSPGEMLQRISRGQLRIGTVVSQANADIALTNLDVAGAYRLSARASSAGHCGPAPATPVPLGPMG